MTSIPEYLPTLASGGHRPGQGQACVMEYVALLAGEQWTDSPQCTHEVLASAARRVNDSISDEHRHLLVPLIGRLFGTTAPSDPVEAKRLAVGLALWCADQVAHLVDPHVKAKADAARAATRKWLDDPSKENAADAPYAAANAAYAAANDAKPPEAATTAAYAAAYAAAYDAPYAPYAAVNAAYAAANAAYAAANDANAKVELLTGLIDEYDRLTGRTEHREVTGDELRDLEAVVRS